MTIQMCKFYRPNKKCTYTGGPCGERLETGEGNICCSKTYYAMSLEQEIKRLRWYLQEIRSCELSSLNVDYDEYETERKYTDYSNIINLIEEALYEVPVEDCRYSIGYGGSNEN